MLLQLLNAPPGADNAVCSGGRIFCDSFFSLSLNACFRACSFKCPLEERVYPYTAADHGGHHDRQRYFDAVSLVILDCAQIPSSPSLSRFPVVVWAMEPRLSRSSVRIHPYTVTLRRCSASAISTSNRPSYVPARPGIMPRLPAGSCGTGSVRRLVIME